MHEMVAFSSAGASVQATAFTAQVSAKKF